MRKGTIMKKKIGVVPKVKFGDSSASNMVDYYYLGNNYIKRVTEAGCIPIGIAASDGWVAEELLDLCDGFLVQGGQNFSPYHFQIIHHAVTTGKRYLGICMGHQLIYAYFELRRRVEARGYTGDLVKAICRYRDEQGPDLSVLEAVPNHYSELLPRGSEDATKHDVNIVPGTLLHRVLGKDTMRIASYHHFHIPSAQKLLKINAWSAKDDGVVEGSEYGDHILGVQGHPEVDDLLPELFQFLAGEV